MIEFKNVSKSYGSIKALADISFKVANGEFVFITGPSGAGKTTLLKLILREILPDSGQIVFDGADIVGLSQEEVPHLRQKIGVVFQDFKVLPERTVRENVEVPLAVVGVNPEEWEARVDQVLKLVGLDKRTELFPSQLSGGELQRVSLARALVVNPKLILADEPTGNLDSETADGVMDLFEKINKEGKTVIMATHNERIIEKYKKMEIKIKEGRIVGQEKVKSEEKIEEKEEEEKEEEKKEEKPKIKVRVEEV
ncbi:cell division ATP-binding protein FtsE [Candidatus Woesebacteria bacterium RIFCSPHIGHO2_12_FULL_46_16]|uniref:Cell division ATP-binding protein FtsE n=1 Tax=Candidatus Woesebacteria bacterium RIFCSPHIGHO2_12_FULL_46_16 TaxID=1802513 RepID=A0A1F8B111_9BACT|nr:MAG: cell division ATP-binding protein FtsE [Candidatus Woesebacteria bacterium RIFCSPHIGHO2_12_FULL_46_16]